MSARIPRDEAPYWLIPMIENLRRRTPASQALIVGLGAPSAAGKGHLVESLERHFGRSLCVLGLDPYYRGREWMEAHDVTSFDDPDALDLDMAAEHLDALRRREAVQMPIYDFPSGKREGYRPFASADIVVVEGLFALRPPVLGKVDFKIFIQTDVHSALLRRLFRDAGPDGRTKQSPREVIAMFFRDVLPSKTRYVDPTYAEADVIIEARYDAHEESVKAGAVEYQLKRRCRAEDPSLERCRLTAPRRAAVFQEDRFLAPKDRSIDGEVLRLRCENGAHWSFTYKGPLVEPNDGVRARHPLETDIAEEDARRFYEEYREIASVRKHRTLYLWDDGNGVALDRAEDFGTFVEVRAKSRKALESLDLQMRAFADLKLEDPPVKESYLEMARAKIT